MKVRSHTMIYVCKLTTSTVDFILVVMCDLLHDGELQLRISFKVFNATF